MSEQIIEQDLLEEFEQQVNKIKDFDISKLKLAPEDNKKLEKFFKKYLDPKEEFPTGARHSIIEKNFAIYIVKNNIPKEQIEEAYQVKGYNINTLISQIKGVLNGTYPEPNISIGELVNWCKEFRPDLQEIFLDDDILKPKPVASKFNLLWDNELQDYQEDNTGWLVERFVKPKHIIVLGAKRASLKSWLVMNLGYCVSLGLPFLNRFQCEQGNVLYLDRENGFLELKKRSAMEKKGLDIQEAPIGFLSETTLKLDNYPDIEAVKAFIIHQNIKLIIADTYRRVISFKEDSADDVSKFFVDTLKPLCEETGVSIILIHHEKKGESSGDDMDMLRGSSDLANYVDGIIQLERKGDYITIKQTKSRGAKELEPFQIKVDTDETSYFKFEYLGAKQSMELIIEKVIVEWILETGKKEFTYTEAFDYCSEQGYKKNNIGNALKDLTNKGLLSKDSHRSPYKVSPDLNLEVFD